MWCHTPAGYFCQNYPPLQPRDTSVLEAAGAVCVCNLYVGVVCIVYGKESIGLSDKIQR